MLVLHDVLDEIVSPDRARREYGVVVDPATRTLDHAATDRLRVDLNRAFETIRHELPLVDHEGYELIPGDPS